MLQVLKFYKTMRSEVDLYRVRSSAVFPFACCVLLEGVLYAIGVRPIQRETVVPDDRIRLSGLYFYSLYVHLEPYVTSLSTYIAGYDRLLVT